MPLARQTVRLSALAIVLWASHGSGEPDGGADEAECLARLKALGLEHGADACKRKPQATPVDEVQELPNKCAADSPRDRPCEGYGGTYRVRVAPKEGSCLGKKPFETTVRLKGDTRYSGRGDFGWELGSLFKALAFKKPEASLGSAAREGVCCVDIAVDGTVGGKERRFQLRLARGRSVVNAKAKVQCSEPGDYTELKAEVTLVEP